MTDEQRLLAAITEAPDDDAPRLVYADWLQSRGDPRGELIQLQCRLAATPDDDRRRAIRIAENKLLAAHETTWLAPLEQLFPKDDPRYWGVKFELERGFVERADLTLDCFAHLDELFERAPLLRRIKVSPSFIGTTPIPKPTLRGALAAPQLSRLRSLALSLGGAGNAVAREIAAAPTLRNLRELELHLSVWGEGVGMFKGAPDDLVLDDRGIEALANAPHLAGIETLLLDSNRITTAGVTAIARAPWKLRRLELAYNLLDPSSLGIALHGPAIQSLEVLGVAGTTFDPVSIMAFVMCPSLANLRELDLEKCHLGVAGVTALCKSFALPSLRRLRLERNTLGDAGTLALAGCERLANLTELEAGHNRIGQKGAKAIASSLVFAKLERLTLNEPRWKPEIADLFAASPTLAKTKIYLKGRLLARGKRSKSEASVEPPADLAAESSSPPSVARTTTKRPTTKPPHRVDPRRARTSKR